MILFFLIIYAAVAFSFIRGAAALSQELDNEWSDLRSTNRMHHG